MASSLTRRLRLKPGQRALFLNAPEGYVVSLPELPEDIEISTELEGNEYDFCQAFVADSAEYAKVWPMAKAAIKRDGVLWITYPKKSSKAVTDLTRDVLWRLSEGSGLRPVSQVSVDEVWSAIRYRPTDLVKTR